MIRFCLLRTHSLTCEILLTFELSECLLLIGIFIQVIYTKVNKSDIEDFFDNIKKGAPANSEKKQDAQ